MLQIAELSRAKEALKEKASRALTEAGIDQKFEGGKSNKVKIVFAGQYSAGKSSIIKMLTGNESVEVGAKITTQEAHTYEWNGLEIVDTPGVHTSLRPDHDEISYKAISEADILVFVITNELFDSYMAEHFRHLAIDKDKAGEMILVVNKMDRAAGGNTKEQQDIIIEGLRDVLAPYTPEQLHLSFIDAQSYLDSVAEREEDPELADELIARSGYSEFINTLNAFVAEKSLTAKLTTELYVLDNELDKAILDLTPGSEDADIDALEENLRQQSHKLSDARARMQREVSDIFANAASEIKELGIDAAIAIDTNLSKEALEDELASYSKKAEELIERAKNDADERVRSRFEELDQNFVEMESTEATQKLKIRLVNKYDQLPDAVKKVFVTATDLENAGDVLIDSLKKSAIPELLSSTNSSGNTLKLTNGTQNNLRSALLTIATNTKLSGKASKKIIKIADKASTALTIASVCLDVALQLKEDYEEHLDIEARKHNRQNIRSAFNTMAIDLNDYAAEYIKQCVTDPMEQSIRTIENNITELRNTRAGRSEMCQKLEHIQNEVQNLISSIHNIA